MTLYLAHLKIAMYGFLERKVSTMDYVSKRFKNFPNKFSFNVSKIVAQQIDCETLDGIYTPDVITLGDYQKIPGKSVFTSLEVSDDLEVILIEFRI